MATPRLRIRDASGTLRVIDGTGTTRIRIRDASGTLRTLTRIRARDTGNNLRVVYDVTGASTLTATPDDLVVGGVGISTATTTTVTVTPSGGTSPYTYAWTRLTSSHGSTNPTALTPTAAATAFRQTNMAATESYTSTWRCTVTDSATPANTATCDITANFMDIS